MYADDHLERLVAREPHVFNGRVTAQPGRSVLVGARARRRARSPFSLFFFFLYSKAVSTSSIP